MWMKVILNMSYNFFNYKTVQSNFLDFDANYTFFTLFFFSYLQCYFFMKHNCFFHWTFYFLLLLQKKVTKKKRPRKPTSIFSFTQNQPKLGLKKLQFALFVDGNCTPMNSEWRVGLKR